VQPPGNEAAVGELRRNVDVLQTIGCSLILSRVDLCPKDADDTVNLSYCGAFLERELSKEAFSRVFRS
jgi:hypothetical protein